MRAFAKQFRATARTPCTVGPRGRRKHGQNDPYAPPPALAPCRQIGQAPAASPCRTDGHAAKASQRQRACGVYLLARDTRTLRGRPGSKRRPRDFALAATWGKLGALGY
jgi:hypothetical protein